MKTWAGVPSNFGENDVIVEMKDNNSTLSIIEVKDGADRTGSVDFHENWVVDQCSKNQNEKKSCLSSYWNEQSNCVNCKKGSSEVDISLTWS